MKIRILLNIKTDTEICDHWSTDPSGLHLEPPQLHFELLKVLTFDFNADPDPVFFSDQDPASKNITDPDPQPWRKYALLMSSQRAKQCLGIRIRRIHMILGLPEPHPDPYQNVTDPQH